MGAFLLSQKPGFPPFRVLRAPFPVVCRKKSFHPARSAILIISKNTPNDSPTGNASGAAPIPCAYFTEEFFCKLLISWGVWYNEGMA